MQVLTVQDVTIQNVTTQDVRIQCVTIQGVKFGSQNRGYHNTGVTIECHNAWRQSADCHNTDYTVRDVTIHNVATQIVTVLCHNTWCHISGITIAAQLRASQYIVSSIGC